MPTGACVNLDGVRFKTGVKISSTPTGRREKIDFWRWGFAPPPKINQKKGICMIVVLLLPQS
jgi:hypothetical protein